MKALLAAVLVCVVLAGCAKAGQPVDVQGAVAGTDYEVAFLFERDGCRVYRFKDERSHYFTTCGEAVTTWKEGCGKGCWREEENRIRTIN